MLQNVHCKSKHGVKMKRFHYLFNCFFLRCFHFVQTLQGICKSIIKLKMVFSHNYHMQLLWGLVILNKLHKIFVAKDNT
jgi:hypothetical protein